jgi:hypothetical protein
MCSIVSQVVRIITGQHIYNTYYQNSVWTIHIYLFSYANQMYNYGISSQHDIRIWISGLTFINLVETLLDSRLIKYDTKISCHYQLLQVLTL